jgi:hypothetical protein
VRPPSRERAVRIAVPVSRPFHVTAISGGAPATGRSNTRGAISPLTRASPATALTLTGASNVRPPLRLVAI